MKQVKILSIENVTHDVMHIKTEKPQSVSFSPGQAVDISLNKPSWEEELRPFTFTSLPTDNYLAFHIKIYPEHNGVTEQIKKLEVNDTLFIGEVFGDIEYKNAGIFIAGGAGITPFISILKNLQKQNKIGDNKLIFANKSANDIIEQKLLTNLLGKNFINVLSEEKNDKFEYGYITKDLIKSQLVGQSTYFYLCGPPPMMDSVMKQLNELGIQQSKLIKEQF